MIGYKRDVLQRQSLSEVKMGRGSPICERVRVCTEECVRNRTEQLLLMTYLNVHPCIRLYVRCKKTTVKEVLT